MPKTQTTNKANSECSDANTSGISDTTSDYDSGDSGDSSDNDSSITESPEWLLPSERNLLINWMQKISIYCKITYDANTYYKNWDTICGIIPIVLNTLILLIKGYEFVYTEEAIINIITYSMLAVSTLMKSVHAFLKLSKQSENMRHTSDKLTDLYLQIQVYLASNNSVNIPCVEFTSLVRADLASLVAKTTNIPHVVMSKYQFDLLQLNDIDFNPTKKL